MAVKRKPGCLDGRRNQTQKSKRLQKKTLVFLFVCLFFVFMRVSKKRKRKGATLRGGVDECVDGGTLIGVIWS